MPRKEPLNALSAPDWIKFTKSWFTLPPGKPDKARTAQHPATYPVNLAEEFIGFFTQPGEIVLDPFAGAGATLEAAENLGRRAQGIELNPNYANLARFYTNSPIHVGDSKNLLQDPLLFPDQSVHYLLNSPPYWDALRRSRGGNKSTRHKIREKTGKALIYGDQPEDLGNLPDVGQYLAELTALFNSAHRILKPRRYCTIIIQNLNHQGSLQPIAWQLALALAASGRWELKGEKIWCKEQGKLGIYGYPTSYHTNNMHHYCLTLQRKEPGPPPD